MTGTGHANIRPEPDKVLVDIAEYVLAEKPFNALAMETAMQCLMDALGCGILALNFPECTKLLGPIVPGAELENGCGVPGTAFRLDPVQGAFNIGTMNRWLDFNDTWLAAEWGHPSDNIGGILAAADYISRVNLKMGKAPLIMEDVLTAMVQAYEIQGCIALENSFNKQGLDHVVLVKVATAAVVANLFGASKSQIIDVLSHAWLDGQSLRTYRHAPNTGSRKSWAAGDATSRGVRLALMVLQGEMGYPSALTAKDWGFYDVSFAGKPFTFQREYGSYIMENILFKISYPAEYHAQTAVEAAVTLHPQVSERLDEIKTINILTQEPAIRIISKQGPLHNPADRDHCLQYMVAVGLLFGDLGAHHYEDDVAADPRIDALREKMEVVEDPEFTRAYYDPERRAFPNAIQICYENGSQSEKVQVDYPIGHRCRREEGLPLLKDKFYNNLASRLPEDNLQTWLSLFSNRESFSLIEVNHFMEEISIHN